MWPHWQAARDGGRILDVFATAGADEKRQFDAAVAPLEVVDDDMWA